MQVSISLLLLGLPLFFMEMALGQYAGIHQFTSPWAASLLHGDGTRTIRRFEPTKTIL